MLKNQKIIVSKIFFIFLSILLMVLIVGAKEIYAYPFLEVEAFVTPVNPTDDENEMTTTFAEIVYTFNVITADEMFPGMPGEMNKLSLEFESSVFFDIGTLSSTDPGNWTPSTETSPSGGTYLIFDAGTTLGTGETFTIVLQNVSVYNNALTDASLWQEGQIWAQSWLTRDIFNGKEGGSTALAAVPEASTWMLLSLCLIGLCVIHKQRSF